MYVLCTAENYIIIPYNDHDFFSDIIYNHRFKLQFIVFLLFTISFYIYDYIL